MPELKFDHLSMLTMIGYLYEAGLLIILQEYIYICFLCILYMHKIIKSKGSKIK